MNPFMLMLGPMYEAAMLIITWLVAATFAVTDKWAMLPPDGSEQARAYYALAQRADHGTAARVEDVLVVALPSGEVFLSVDPREILSGNVEDEASATDDTRRFKLASERGGRMDCTVARAAGGGKVAGARCATDDGRIFELRT